MNEILTTAASFLLLSFIGINKTTAGIKLRAERIPHESRCVLELTAHLSILDC